jgi:hypothetical protein
MGAANNLFVIQLLVIDYSKRKNIPANIINYFIENALSRANRALRIPPLERYSSLAISSEGAMQLPSDFMEVKELSVQVGNRLSILDRKTINEVDSIQALYSVVGSPAKPEVFGRYGNYFKMAPWSEGSDLFANLYYYAAEPQLVDPGDSNWFTDWAPDLLVYGAMAELCTYTRDEDGAALWDSKFTNEINILQAVEDRATWSGSSIAVSRNGSIRGRRGVI